MEEGVGEQMPRDEAFPLPLDVLLAALDESQFALAASDQDGRLLWVNAAWERLLGYSREELIALPHWASLVHPQELARLRELNERRVAGDAVPEAYETVFVRKDGTSVPAEVALQSLRVGEGTVVLGVVRDISARRAAEQEAQHLASIVASTSDAVVSVTVDQRVTSWNAAAERLFGYTAAEALGRTVTELGITSGKEDVAGLLSRVERGEAIGEHETHRVRRDGSAVPVSLSATPLVDETGEIVGFAGIYRDISQRLRAEEEERLRDQAEQASRLKSEFLAAMSHEIRTPMNGVLGMVQLLLESDLDEDQRGYAELIQVSATSLLGVIGDILDFSRIEAGHLDLDEVELDPAEVLEDVLDVAAGAVGDQDIELVLTVDEAVPSVVRGDPGRFRQVGLNLVGNAVKFTDHGEVHVVLTAGPEDDGAVELRVAVRDTGAGIPEDAQEELFESFAQAAGSRHRYGGTGLGLAIARQLVERMGGVMGVDSTPGRGSTFWFTARVPVVRREPVVGQALEGLRVLVVHALATARDALAQQLAGWGAAVVVAGDLEEARRATLCDVVVADLERGGASAHELPDSLLAGTPLVVLASQSRLVEARRELGAGSEVLLVGKPVRRAHLLRAVSSAGGRGVERRVPPGDPERAPVSGRVLVVDDNAANRRLATVVLEGSGFAVDVATTGAEAVEAFRRGGYAAVVMDCEMPVMDGYDATREIRRLERGLSHVPVVALTAHALGEHEDRALSAGMDAFVTKPVDVHLLRETVVGLVSAGGAASPPAFDARALDRFQEADPSGALLGDLVALFARDVPPRCEELVTAAAQGDLEAVRRCAHSLWGSAVTMGTVELAARVGRIEDDARDGRHPDEAALAAMRTATDAALVHLESLVGESTQAT